MGDRRSLFPQSETNANGCELIESREEVLGLVGLMIQEQMRREENPYKAVVHENKDMGVSYLQFQREFDSDRLSKFIMVLVKRDPDKDKTLYSSVAQLLGETESPVIVVYSPIRSLFHVFISEEESSKKDVTSAMKKVIKSFRSSLFFYMYTKSNSLTTNMMDDWFDIASALNIEFYSLLRDLYKRSGYYDMGNIRKFLTKHYPLSNQFRE